MAKKSTFIIAEIAQAHDGSLGILHSYIDAAARCGVDAVKFQTHIAEVESSEFEPFRVNFSYVDKTRMDYWARMSFTLDQWREIKAHCDEVGVEFMSSPFSMQAVDWLEELRMKRYKIASGEIGNHLMVDRIAATKKPVIVSSGMSSFAELDACIGVIKAHHNDIAMMQCTTAYPTAAEQIGFNVMDEMRERYGYPVGLSDHSANLAVGIAAAARGAEYFEAHIVFDRSMFGPDAKASLTVDEFKKMVEAIRFVDTALMNPVEKNDVEKYDPLKVMFGKSLALRRDIKAGEIIRYEDLETKKPARKGVEPRVYKDVVGRKAARNLTQNAFLNEEDLA